jgi:hypothetical protein
MHDSHTLPEILSHVEASRGKAAKRAYATAVIAASGKLTARILFYLGRRSSRISAIKGTKNENNVKDEQPSNPSSVI